MVQFRVAGVQNLSQKLLAQVREQPSMDYQFIEGFLL